MVDLVCVLSTLSFVFVGFVHQHLHSFTSTSFIFTGFCHRIQLSHLILQKLKIRYCDSYNLAGLITLSEVKNKCIILGVLFSAFSHVRVQRSSSFNLILIQKARVAVWRNTLPKGSLPLTLKSQALNQQKSRRKSDRLKACQENIYRKCRHPQAYCSKIHCFSLFLAHGHPNCSGQMEKNALPALNS